jgi:hypothetical protein
MRPSVQLPKSLFDAASETPDFRSPIADLTPVAPPTFVPFPKFPTWQEMQAGTHPLLMSEQPTRREPQSLFQGLMGGNLPALVADSVDHPERYDQETQLFLSELGAGARQLSSLTASDRAHLDRAVLDFASYKPRHVPPPAPPPTPLARAGGSRPKNPYEAGLEDDRAPQVEIPGNPMSSYWWDKGSNA